MPPIQGQQITANGFTITTQKFGVIEVTITTQGATTTIIVTKAAVEILNTNVNNATPAIVEQLINNAINGQLLGANQTLQDFYAAVHVYVVNPLSLTMISSNTPVTGTWWP